MIEILPLYLQYFQVSHSDPQLRLSNDEDGNLQRALQESVKDSAPHTVSYGTEKSVPMASRDQILDEDDDDEDLRRALQLSLQQNDNSPDNDLRRALQMSLECEFN